MTILVRCLSFILRSVPFSKLHLVSGPIALLLKAYRGSIISQNLEKAFPSKETNELKSLSCNYRNHLGNILCESLKGFSMSQLELAERFVFLNPELANQYLDQGRSIILTLGHVGNWEWGQAIVSHYLRFNCVGVYKTLSNKSVNSYILKKRSQYGVKLYSQKDILKFIISNKTETNVYIFIADQYPPAEPRLALNFLNQQTFFDASVEKIAKKYDLPVLYADIRKVSEHNYKTTLKEVTNTPSQTAEGFITKGYAKFLEENIRQLPESWLWSHKRWK